MKRTAENQLTKDSPYDEDDEIEEIQDPNSFQRADESALAKRQIRGLPKRTLATSRPSSLNGLPPAPVQDAEKAETAPPPKFGSFAGFGAGTAASNPFTFTAQSPTLPTPASDTAFKSTKQTPTASPFLGAHTPSPLDDNAFSPKPATSSPAEGIDTVAFKYFKSLRGLNVSFVSAISAAVEKDPFFDVANLVESYKNLRTTIQSEFDTSSQSSTDRVSAPTNSTPLFGAKAPPEKTSLFSMPKPPVGSADASPKLSATSESGTKTSGFTFAPFIPPSSSTPAQLPFAFASKPAETSSLTAPDPPKSAFTFGASKTSVSTSSTPPSSGFSFGVSPSVENAASKSVPPTSQETEGPSTTSSRPASTVPSFGSSSVPNFFSTKPTSAFGTDATSKAASVFTSSIFGSNGTTESNRPSLFTPPPSDSKDDSKVNTSLFGNTSSSTTTSIFGSSSDKQTTFFGSASPPKTNPFAFGKPAGSIGNPVGFGFGGSSLSSGDTASSSGSAFGFGVASAKPSESLFSPPPTDKSTESTPQPDAEGNEEGGEEDAAKLLPSHAHDGEGEGEEDEETTHVIRCKVYRLSKSDDKNEWKDLGVGMFRLKKHKATHVRRALMRNSSTGRILINFRIYAGLKPSMAKTSISFIGYEDNTPTSFRIRVKTEEQAAQLKQAMEREIAASQATD